MTKQKKLRHAEYYDMQEVLDKLYVDSKDICNEEGKINGLPLNRAIYDDDKNRLKLWRGHSLLRVLQKKISGAYRTSRY